MISIITINYNNAAGLEQTIQSVVGQTLSGMEYIVIDGGSNDGSVDVIRRYEDRIRYWVSEPDTGVYNAMNKGIVEARGGYVLFLNSGDYFSSNTILEKVVSSHDFKEDIIYGDLYFENKGEIVREKKYPDVLTFKYFFHNESLPHPSSFIRKSLFEKVGFYNEAFKIVSDWEFWLKAIFLFQATYMHLPFPISVFDIEGISSKAGNRELVTAEKEQVYARYFPGIVENYKEHENLRRYLRTNIFIRILKKFKLLEYGQ